MTLSRFRVSERQALHFVMAACVIGLACAFLFVFLRRRAPRADGAKRPIVRWIMPRATADVRQLIVEIEDPSLMSLPDQHGFSGALWRHRLAVPGEPITAPDSVAYLDTTPPRELATLLPATPLAETVRAAADKTVAAVAEPASAPAAAPERTVVEFGGRLELFPGLPAPALPAIASETPLRGTRLRLGIAADGTVVHALVERSCGNERADALALEAARQFRFALPSETDRRTLLWGTAQVLWATKAP